MSTTLATSFLFKTPTTTAAVTTPFPSPPSLAHFRNHHKVKASSSTNTNHPIIQNLKTLTKTTILLATTASVASRFSLLTPPPPARAEATMTQESQEQEDEREIGEEAVEKRQQQQTHLSGLLDSSPEAIESLKSLLQQKLEIGEDEEALKILTSLESAQPTVTDWKFLKARLLSEIGKTNDARKVFEEILALNPLSFEALFENALLMDRCGEGEAVIRRLEKALEVAQEEKKAKEARDVRLIMAQIQFLQKNVDGALRSYLELSKEDPKDFRPYFCQGMIYSLLDRDEKAKEYFAKYRELSPKKYEVDGYLRTPLSRMKVFGSANDDEK